MYIQIYVYIYISFGTDGKVQVEIGNRRRKTTGSMSTGVRRRVQVATGNRPTHKRGIHSLSQEGHSLVYKGLFVGSFIFLVLILPFRPCLHSSCPFDVI